MVLLVPGAQFSDTNPERPTWDSHGAQGVGQEFGPGLDSFLWSQERCGGDDQLVGGFTLW